MSVIFSKCQTTQGDINKCHRYFSKCQTTQGDIYKCQ